MIRKTITLLLIFFVFNPSYIFGQVRISEIMYNLDGSDENREWIEITNIGATSVNVGDLEVKDQGGTHRTVYFSGAETISTNEYAIFAENPDTFKIDHPNYSGPLFKSAITLNNTGDTIQILDKNSNSILYEITYHKEKGANGDGDSLHIDSSGNISANTPTPGGIQSSEVKPTATTNNNSQNSESSSSSRREFSHSLITTDPKIGYLKNIPIEFAIVHIDNDGERIRYTPTVWNFGDGTMTKSSGKIKHKFQNEGTYSVTTEFIFRRKETIEQKTINVVTPNLEIALSDRLISIKNNHPFEVNISDWKVESLFEKFTFPKNTFLLGNSSITLNKKFIEADTFTLLSSNNIFITKYDKNKEVVLKDNPIEKVEEKNNPIIESQDENIDMEEEKPILITEQTKNNNNNNNNETKNDFSSLISWFLVLVVLILIALLPLFIEFFSKLKK